MSKVFREYWLIVRCYKIAVISQHRQDQTVYKPLEESFFFALIFRLCSTSENLSAQIFFAGNGKLSKKNYWLIFWKNRYFCVLLLIGLCSADDFNWRNFPFESQKIFIAVKIKVPFFQRKLTRINLKLETWKFSYRNQAKFSNSRIRKNTPLIENFPIGFL